MGRLFGTDGARGIAITELTCELAMQIGRAAAIVLTKKTSHKPMIYIGKDTRISSDILEAALVAGICSVGANVTILGIVPTPAVAYLVKANKADAGIMISASHNSVEFNGIKIFSSTGYKLPDDVEEEIEELILDKPEEIVLSSGVELGCVCQFKDAQWDYIRYLMKSMKTDLKGIRVVLDCANGSASVTAEKLFSALGAKCFMINASPDGTNINDKCGSTYIEGLIKAVKEKRADIGIAFDGDADRCLAVDENGVIVDGDKIIAIVSKAYKDEDKLKNNTVVVTVMTNLGFSFFAKENEIKVVTAQVGDRYVLEKMLDGGHNIGGEQSGHIIFLDESTTGDGQLSGMKLLEILVKSGKKMSELAAVMDHYPQVMINVKISTKAKETWKNDPEITGLISQREKDLNAEGRILVRESGTEPLIRVMLEGKNFEQINNYAIEISEMIKQKVGIDKEKMGSEM